MKVRKDRGVHRHIYISMDGFGLNFFAALSAARAISW